MSIQQTLINVSTCVQGGQVDAAIKLYRGLLVSMAHHPQINTERTSAVAMSMRPVPF